MNVALAVTLLFGGIVPLEAAGPIWGAPACIDCPAVTFEMGDRSLALDGGGRPHVVYAGDALYYARFDGAAWQVETVDAAPGIDDIYPSPAALALDAAGAPHVSYLSATSSALKYAHRTPQGWQVETVDSLPDGRVFNYDTALALDNEGRPCIAYPKEGWLYYATRSGSGWTIQLVDPAMKVEFHVSLALDPLNRPHVSYGVWRDSRLFLKYAHRTGSAWASEVVEDGFLGEYNSIAVDREGAAHISYLDYANNAVKVAARTAAGWAIETVDTVRWYGGFTSLALDGADRPHVSYAGPPVGLRYARRNATGWQIETVGDAGRHTSLALDAADRPYMACFDTAARSVAYGRRGDAGWSWDAVDRLADTGGYVAEALGDGAAVVAYYEAGHGDLRVARPSCSPPEVGPWAVETVDAAGDVGAHAAIALDRAGLPLVSYYDATRGDLKVARDAGAAWVIGTVDAAGDVGQYTAIALDAAGSPWVSYYDATNGSLKVARWMDGGSEAGSWQIGTVDATGDVGQYADIALDARGDAWISYYDATNGDLKVAHWTASPPHAGRLPLAGRFPEAALWQIETVDSAGDVGAHTALALDGAGSPRVGYYDATNGDLKHAWLAGGAWQIETVDARGTVGVYTSLALDAAGRPAISYASTSGDELRFARWTGSAWAVQTLRQGWQVAGHTALAVDARGYFTRSYHDPGWHALRVQYGAPWGAYLPLIANLQSSIFNLQSR